jgi:hypothetical protein
MRLSRIHSFLVHPGKAMEVQPEIGGTEVALDDLLGGMLTGIFENARVDCNIEIVFQPDAGVQHNACRDDVVAYVSDPTLDHGRRLAERLQLVTTNRSGLGLLFLMTGTEGKQKRVVVSRFPADQGIIAEEDRDRLSVEFIERVFMKSAHAYKSVVYQSDSLKGGFWDGRAIDKQIAGGLKEISDYWVRDFLLSDLRVTGPAGTKRFALGLREAIRTSGSLDQRQELVAAAGVARGFDGSISSARQLMTRLALSPESIELVEAATPNPTSLDEAFEFVGEEFSAHLLYRMVELDNGGVLLADDSKFDEVFQREVEPNGERVRFSTEGRIHDERLRQRR